MTRTAISTAQEVFNKETQALELVRDSLGTDFEAILEAITECEGKVILTGMGKSGHIAKKITATLSSLGTSSSFLHPAEALHGDLGLLQKKDIIMIFSNSGESEEVIRILSSIKIIGCKIIGVSGNRHSTLIEHSDLAYIFPAFEEACPLQLAPTCSTTATLVFGDALAICAAEKYGFTHENFALFHPAGSLGKKLLFSVTDLMHKGETDARVKLGGTMKDALIEMSEKALGIVTVLDNERLTGVITDGDIRRSLASGIDIYQTKIDDVMTKDPLNISGDAMAVEALQLMNEKGISALPVTLGDKVIGTIRINDITKAGIVI